MHCPYCQSDQTEVVETRVAEDGNNIRRRRLCSSCKKRFTTYERIENITLLVKKKDEKTEQFNREKLKGGILKSSEKTAVTLEQVEEIVDDIERELLGGETVEVDNKQKTDYCGSNNFSSLFCFFLISTRDHIHVSTINYE